MHEPMKGVNHEIAFWTDFVKTDRFLNNWASDHPNPELRPEVREFVQAGMLGKHSEILDVGSGVVSILYGSGAAEKPNAVDPLAKHYAKLFNYDQHGIEPPLPIAAENLEYIDRFDYVHMSNALDHTQNPVNAYRALLRAARPGGFVIVQGFVNEGTFEKWQGMHQWDISINEEGHLFIANKQGGGVKIFQGKISANTFDLET